MPHLPCIPPEIFNFNEAERKFLRGPLTEGYLQAGAPPHEGQLMLDLIFQAHDAAMTALVTTINRLPDRLPNSAIVTALSVLANSAEESAKMAAALLSEDAAATQTSVTVGSTIQ